MRRFLVSLAALFILLWGADFVVGRGLAYLFHRSAREDGDVFGHAIADRAPIIVCGSSRAEHHYMIDSLETELGVRAYDLGLPKSWGALYEYGAASIILRHYVPRLWIMEVETGTYTYPERLQYLVDFQPYVREEPAAAELLDMRSGWERVKRLSSIYPYNSLLASLLASYAGHSGPGRKGFVPLHGSLADDPLGGVDPRDQPVPLGRPAPDSLKMLYLRKTLDLLRAHGVEVIAVRGPYWPPTALHAANDRQVERNLREVFGGLGIRYFDFATPHTPVFRDPTLFFDPAHLNEKGALVFTRALADSIRTLPDAPSLLGSAGRPVER